MGTLLLAGLPATAGTAATGDTGTITGRLTGPGGTPAPGVDVYTEANFGYVAGSAVTAADGTYSMLVPPGTHIIVFRSPEIATEYYDDAATWSTAMPVTVGAGETVSGVDAVVTPGGSIAGRVTDEVGAPVAGLTFQIDWVGASGNAFSAIYRPQLRTAADGGFAITALHPGTYRLILNDPALRYVDTFVTFQVTDGATTVGDTAVVRGGLVTGVITGPQGHDVNLRPTVGTVDVRTSAYEYDRVTGRYTVLLPAGDHALRFDAAGYVAEYYDDAILKENAAPVHVVAGQVTSGVDVQLSAGATVSGRVLGPVDEPVAAWVSVNVRGATQVAQTAADGSFTVAGVPPGTATLSVSAPSTYRGQYDWAWDSAAATPFPVPEGAAVTGIDVQLWYADLSHVFSDVPGTHPFVREISWMKANGITTGNADGTYGPTASVTREAMAAFLYRMAGRPSYTPPVQSPFTDVATTHPFYKEICWLSSQGITTGWADRTFRPGLAVERQAMAAFLYRFAGKPAFTPPATSPFTDVPPSHPFYREIAWLAVVGVTSGYADGGYHPLAPVDRQSMAAFLNRMDRKVLP